MWVLALVLACGRREAPSLTSDPAEASATITKLATTGCAGLSRAIDQLARSTFHGRALIELVDDALVAGREHCPAPALEASTAAAQLARARLADAKPADALAMLTADEPAVHIRRAELLDQLGRAPEALRELATVTGEDTTRRLLAVSVAARAGQPVAALIAAAPITEQTSLAFRAVADAPVASLPALAAGAPAALATAIADRIEREAGPAAALAPRARAVEAAPAIAEYWDALGRAQIAAGQLVDALASWDHAIELAPAQPAFRLTPIRALVIANEPARARERAASLATAARAGNDVELHLTASTGAAIAGEHDLAIALAKEAVELRPGDGRLVFELAQRHAGAGHRGQAAALYGELLTCGTHGKPWHRHEVAAKLRELGDRPAILAALDHPYTCTVVDAPDLARYVEALRAKP